MVLRDHGNRHVSPAKRCWQPSSAHCFSATRDAICSTSPMPSTYSPDRTQSASSNASGEYLERSKIRISRAEAEQRMFAKLNNPGFLTDMRPLLAVARGDAADG